MRILSANLWAIVAISLCAPAALAQGPAGAGGAGGAGGGADSRRVVAVREVDRDSLCVAREDSRRAPAMREPISRDRMSKAPPLDPARSVNAVDCTKPFDFLGKGNLCCI